MSESLVPIPQRPVLQPSVTWTAPAPPPAEDVELRDAWSFLIRNRLLIGGVTALGVAIGFGVVELITPIYEASASLRVEESGPQLAVGLPTLGLGDATGTLLTDIETLRSRTFATELIDRFALRVEVRQPLGVARSGLIVSVTAPPDAAGRYRLEADGRGRFTVIDVDGEARIRSADPGEAIVLGNALVHLGPAAAGLKEIELEILPLDVAMSGMQDALDVRRRRGDVNVVDVRFRSPDRHLARDVPNALTASFIADRLQVQRAQAHGTAEFLRTQITKMAVQLDSAEAALRSFREAENVISPLHQAGAEVQNAAQLKAQRDALAAESAALAALTADGRSHRELVAFPTLLRNPAVSGLLTSLSLLEDRRAELLARRSETDPEVQLLVGRAAEIEAQLGAMAAAYQRGLEDQAAALDRVLSRSQAEMRVLPAREVRLARLQREAGVLEEIYTQMQTRLKEAEIGEAAGDLSVRLLDAAVLPREPVIPRPATYLGLALALGLLAGVGTAAAREYADRSIHSRRDVSRLTGLPVLGLIPRAGVRPVPRRGAPATRRQAAHPALWDNASRTPLAEAYDRFQVNLAFSPSPMRVVTLTSPSPKEGKTTSAINLAATMTRRVPSVLLVDADLRCGVVAEVLGLPQTPGLTELLTGAATLDAVLQQVRLQDGNQLTVLGCGHRPTDPARLLGSTQMRDLLARLRTSFEAIVIDAPPVNLMADAVLLATLSDGVVIVVRSGSTTEDELRDAVMNVQAVGAPLLGVVMNDVDFRDYGYDRAYRSYRRGYASYA